MTAYELRALKLPKLTGTGLKAFTTAVENRVGRSLLLGSMLENGGIPKLERTVVEDPPTFYPLVDPQSSQGDPVPFQPGAQPDGFPYRTIQDFARAFRAGDLSPVEAAERVLKNISDSDQGDVPLRAFIAIHRDDVLAQARAAAGRIAAGRSLGPLDGVPVAIKDEVDVAGYPTTVGTAFLGKHPAAEDSTVAARLRAAGTVIIGKANMHEIGINPNGSNVTYGATRNPYNVSCDTGGSSSGPGTAVAAGIVPLAVGADGGGSIRIPASLCGVVGLKSTFGRVSEAGAAPLCWTMGHLGPLAASVEDVALAYSLIAGPDPRDPNTRVQPPVTLANWNRPDLKGVRLGIYRDWFEHASPEMVQVCQAMVTQLKEAGAEICEIEIPWLDEMRVAHAVTILSEIATAMKSYRDHRKEHGEAVRLSLILGETFTAEQYLRCQRIRTRALSIFQEVFRNVDAILTPGTAMTAQSIPAGGLSSGWSDLATDTEMMRYVFPGNLVGLPAITFPAGYDSRGMPVGMQAMGRHWEEHLLLRIAFNAERSVQRKLPERYYPVF